MTGAVQPKPCSRELRSKMSLRCSQWLWSRWWWCLISGCRSAWAATSRSRLTRFSCWVVTRRVCGASLSLSEADAAPSVTGGVRSGQVRFITRPKSRTMRATRQLMLPAGTDTGTAVPVALAGTLGIRSVGQPEVLLGFPLLCVPIRAVHSTGRARWLQVQVTVAVPA